jgi:hypothetical protein
MSWKAEVNTYSDSADTWTGNALRFATPEEAKHYGDNLFSRWTAVKHVRVVESTDQANYTWDRTNHRAVSMAEAPPRPIEPNRLKKGAVIRTHDGDIGEIADNKLGIIRVMRINGEVGSAYVDRIKAAFVDGRWHPVAPSQAQARKLRVIHKRLADLGNTLRESALLETANYAVKKSD